MWAQEIWVIEQLRKYVPEEIFENIQIQSEVLEMDSAFSFYKAVFEDEPQSIPALLEGLKHSSTG
jgi:hypothetical protein